MKPSKEEISVQRYRLQTDRPGLLAFIQHDDGDWIQYKDFAALQTQLNDCVESHQKVNADCERQQQTIEELQAERDHNMAEFHKAMDQAQNLARELDRERKQSKRWNEVAKKLGPQYYGQQQTIEALVGALDELLKMVREDEASPVMHNEHCSAWCHYRPILQKCDAALAKAKDVMDTSKPAQ